MDYSQLSDFEINKRVFKDLTGAKPLGYPHNADGRSVGNESNGHYCWYDYCNNPADAWPIIMENMISVCTYKRANPGMKAVSWWEADSFGEHITRDDNPLRAAMIVFLMMQDAKHV